MFCADNNTFIIKGLLLLFNCLFHCLMNRDQLIMVMGKDKGHFSGGGCTARVSTMWAANCFIHPSASDPRFTHPCQTMYPFQHDLKMCSFFFIFLHIYHIYFFIGWKGLFWIYSPNNSKSQRTEHLFQLLEQQGQLSGNCGLGTIEYPHRARQTEP